MIVRFLRRRRWMSLVILYIMIISCAGITPPVRVEAARVRNSDRIIVSLGDSYSSGEGILPFYGQEKEIESKVDDHDWVAHRSTKSWPGQLKLSGLTMSDYRYGENMNEVHWYFAAVSGAKIKNVNSKAEENHQVREVRKSYFNLEQLAEPEPSDGVLLNSLSVISRDVVYDRQLDIFDKLGDKKADYVTITIGGNDLGFEDIIIAMVKDFEYLKLGDLDKKLDAAYKKLDNGSIKKKLVKLYKDISETAGDQTAIIVAGYPQLFTENYGFFISKDESRKVNKGVKAFNNVIKAAVEESADNGVNIHFVPVDDAFKGHRAYADEPYINEVIVPSRSEDIAGGVASSYSVHPNEKGAEVYRRCVQEKIDELEKKKRGEILQDLVRETDLTCELYSPSEALMEDWEKAYLEQIRRSSQKGYLCVDEVVGANTWFIYDIDSDGTPELFIRYGFARMSYIIIMYAYESGMVREVGQVDTGPYGMFYDIPEKGMLTYYGVQGYAGVSILKYEGGEINSYQYFEEDAHDRDYTPLAVIYPGAKPLDEHPVYCILPLFAGEQVIPSASDDLSDEEVRQRLEDTYSKNGTVCWTAKYDDNGVYSVDIAFNDLLNDYLNEGLYFKITDIGWGDLNSDGRMECLLNLQDSQKSDHYYSAQIILSLQNGTVYAYRAFAGNQLNDWKCLEIKDGKIYEEGVCLDTEHPPKYIRFYKEQSYALWEFVW